MGCLSKAVHLKNKYPGAQVIVEDNKLDVFVAGELKVALRKNGKGMWEDVSEKLGATDKFCLAPIPKEARAWKLFTSEKGVPYIGKAEEHETRLPKATELARAHGGRVPSMPELEAIAKKQASLPPPAAQPQLPNPAAKPDVQMAEVAHRAFQPVTSNGQ